MPRIDRMNETARDGAPGQPGSDSWADETLPLGLRRELLDRELQKFIARKNRGQSADPARAAAREPDADRPVPHDRASDRPG
jgi:hypothetical protein